ncbi:MULTISPECIES: anti-sigma F factor antagonist [Clostridium]|uniref:Anti-sigma F factor antagonist n=2 Tax=Clostridium TaxID=1485 RepID=A0A9W5XYV4_9CLOT|nr:MULTISPECIES: anti-sigma F factor antagonist [Clostridium]MBK1812892.1 anti-sigma F factor antagonist [Clostridium yunnanense]GKU23604.1 anti-sigma F factor antagonist [Clostridium folliculivorans]GKU29720.1 anti-sigma F factor antagonist [Clostridium folliculivorans]
MDLNFKKVEDNLIVALTGELDHHSAEEIRVKVDDRIDRDGVKSLVFDFSRVTFMDSSGIGMVIGRYKRLLMRNGKVSVVAANKNVKRVFELSGMFKIINSYESIDDAIKCI